LVKHSKSQLIVVEFSINGWLRKITQRIVHPTHIPLHIEPQSIVFRWPSHAAKRCGFFRNGDGFGKIFMNTITEFA
jgi:hypothetical protein